MSDDKYTVGSITFGNGPTPITLPNVVGAITDVQIFKAEHGPDPSNLHTPFWPEEKMMTGEITPWYPKVKIVRPDKNLPLPTRKYPDDAGSDLICLKGSLLKPFQTKRVDTNCRIAVPDTHFGWVTSRSGISEKGVLVHQGIIDCYTGVIGVIMTNLSNEDVIFEPGDRIAQFIMVPKYYFEWDEDDDLPPTQRGANGFGSTGIK